MNIHKQIRFLILLPLIITCFGLQNAYSDNHDGKEASDVYLAYIESAQKADSFDDITSYWAGWMAESFDRGSDEQKKARLERLKNSAADKKDAKVVGTKKEGDLLVVDLKAVYPNGDKMKGQVKMIQENGKYVIEEEYWTLDME